MNKVKFGDMHAITFTVTTEAQQPVDLTGATIRLLARRVGAPEAVVLLATLGDGLGEVVHQLDGTLAVGVYHIEIEVTSGQDINTAPTDGYAELVVARSIV